MKKFFILLSFLSFAAAKAQNFTTPLPIPDTITGPAISLTLFDTIHEFWPGVNTMSMGVNGTILGPTLILNEGDSVAIAVNNQLGQETTVHWHGLHVPADMDGGPHTHILDGETWNVNFQVKNRAATYWYHPHPHMMTEEHAYMGIGGFIIVRDAEEAALDLPRKYGVDDFPIVLQDRSFDPTGQFLMEVLADSMMVNGAMWPVLTVPAQRVRMRLLNGSTARNYNIGFSDNTVYKVIGSDGSLFEQPYNADTVLLTNGERAEIVTDFSGRQGDTLYLMSFASTMGTDLPGGLSGMAGGNSALNQIDFNLLKIIVGPPTANPAGPVPANLVSLTPWDTAGSSNTRTKDMSGMGSHMMGNFFINGLPFDLAFINDTIQLNSIEIWEIINSSNVAHPFHIHDVQFYVLDENGSPPSPLLSGLKDVILVRPNDTIRFITKFEDFASWDTPYMFHCHNLMHEDDGMMGQFIVVDTLTGRTAIADGSKIQVWPNPTEDKWTIRLGEVSSGIHYSLTDVNGRLLKTETLPAVNRFTIDASALPPGIYFAVIETGKEMVSVKLVR